MPVQQGLSVAESLLLWREDFTPTRPRIEAPLNCSSFLFFTFLFAVKHFMKHLEFSERTLYVWAGAAHL